MGNQMPMGPGVSGKNQPVINRVRKNGRNPKVTERGTRTRHELATNADRRIQYSRPPRNIRTRHELATNADRRIQYPPPPRKHFPIAGAQSTWNNHPHLCGFTASYKPIQYKLA